MTKPAFLITIDTEGDNLWRNRQNITTHNVQFLPRFQRLCEQHGFKPTWLTNYEMACDPQYVGFAKAVLKRNQGEVGMHLHAWYTPPHVALTDDDWRWQPYLIEYPDDVLQQKVAYMTQLLENTFEVKMLSHRAGRWAFDERYLAALLALGYQVDCSVTPGVDWSANRGAPAGTGGSDYTHFPDRAYFLDVQNIASCGTDGLLELPMSLCYKHTPFARRVRRITDCLRGKKHAPAMAWLRPARGNLRQMKRVVNTCLAKGNDYIEFMLHSSELMPDGSPTFKTHADIEQLYHDLTELFRWLAPQCVGMTLAEYNQRFRELHKTQE